MKKSIVVLAMMLGIGSSVAFAQDVSGQDMSDEMSLDQSMFQDGYSPIEEQELPEVVISTLNSYGALIKEAYASFTIDRGRIFKVVILSCDQKEKTVYLDQRGQFIKP
ncbi:hypothetical protein [Bacteroides sp.]